MRCFRCGIFLPRWCPASTILNRIWTTHKRIRTSGRKQTPAMSDMFESLSLTFPALHPCRGSGRLKTSRLPTNLTLIAALSFCICPVGKWPLTARVDLTGDCCSNRLRVFRNAQAFSRWPWRMSNAVDEIGKVRKIPGTPWLRGCWKAPDHGLLCSCAPEMYRPSLQGGSLPMARRAAS